MGSLPPYWIIRSIWEGVVSRNLIVVTRNGIIRKYGKVNITRNWIIWRNGKGVVTRKWTVRRNGKWVVIRIITQRNMKGS